MVKSVKPVFYQTPTLGGKQAAQWANYRLIADIRSNDSGYAGRSAF